MKDNEIELNRNKIGTKNHIICIQINYIFWKNKDKFIKDIRLNTLLFARKGKSLFNMKYKALQNQNTLNKVKGIFSMTHFIQKNLGRKKIYIAEKKYALKEEKDIKRGINHHCCR